MSTRESAEPAPPAAQARHEFGPARRCAGDHADDLVRTRGFRLAMADDASAPHHPDAARDAKNLIEIVTDHQHGQPLALEPEDHLFDRLGFGDAERRGRLVHEDEFRAPRAGARDRHHLPLPARQQFHRFVDRRHVADEPTSACRACSPASRPCRGRAGISGPGSVRGRDRHCPRPADSRQARDPDRRFRRPSPALRPAKRNWRARRRTRSSRRRGSRRR